MYYKYLNYLIRHRWFVMLACFREGLYWQGLIHDWSKFLPSEFVPYAWYFYGEKFPSIYEYHGDHRNFALNSGYYKERVERDFNRAWLAHQHRNPHHWQHWVLREDSGNTLVLPMPHKYRVEMLCDWQGAGRAIHGRYDASDPYGETREWYAKNAEKMMLHDETRAWVEAALGIERVEYWVQYKSKRGKVWHDDYTQATAKDVIGAVAERKKFHGKYEDFRAVKRTTVTTITEEVIKA